jgi:hypothetical protein
LYGGDKIAWMKLYGGHNNCQAFLIEKLFNLIEWKKSKSDNVVAAEAWKKDDDPSEYKFLISNF